MVRIPASDFFAKVDIDPLVRESCSTYAIKMRKHDFKYVVSFYATFERSFSDAHDFHQSLNLTDTHRNLEKKQSLKPYCTDNKNLQTKILAKVEEIQ